MLISGFLRVAKESKKMTLLFYWVCSSVPGMCKMVLQLGVSRFFENVIKYHIKARICF